MILQGKGLWKFNNSLTPNAEYAEKLTNHIFETLRILDQDNITDKQFRSEFLKYKNFKFTIQFSKNLIKEENEDRKFFEKELKKILKKT